MPRGADLSFAAERGCYVRTAYVVTVARPNAADLQAHLRGRVRPSPDGTVVITNDPGVALITGKCADIGRFTVPTIRSLPARAPYLNAL